MMDGTANHEVSIEQRNKDCHLELESGKRGGGKGQEEVLVESKNTWNTIFIISCALAILVDPWYLYAVHVIHHREYKCWERDLSLLWTYIGLRSAVDVFYAIDFLISLGVIRFGSIAVTAPPTHKLLQSHVLYLILVGFPLPEGLILLSSKCLGLIKYDGDLTYALMMSTPIQYSLRVYHIYQSLRQRHPILKTGMRKWLLQAIMDFLPFILASHLFGALWYRLAVQRQIDCWKQHCDILLGPHCKSQRSHDFYCDDLSQIIGNLSKWDDLCPVKEADPEVFDFGIYLYALQSNLTVSTSVARRMSQSFWWALRNLSSFGSNLQTSMNTFEIILSVLISISGMALFLVYLNARVQFKLEKKNKLLKPDVESWLQKNCPSSDLSSHQNDLPPECLVTVIMENIHKLGDDKDIDLKNMLTILPMKDQKSIIHFLCFDSLKKEINPSLYHNHVPVLENINDNILRKICEHLKPVIYTEDSYIIQEGRPQGKMFFIVKGSAYIYTTSNINNTGKSNEWLKRGDCYGQELLNWAFGSPSISDLPISNRTVMCQEKIEAFAIRACDLKSVASSSGILA